MLTRWLLGLPAMNSAHENSVGEVMERAVPDTEHPDINRV